MPRGKKFRAEQIIGKLREAEVHPAEGKTVGEAAFKFGVTEQTNDRWKREYGGLRTERAKRLKDLKKEIARLKRLLADAELDKAVQSDGLLTAVGIDTDGKSVAPDATVLICFTSGGQEEHISSNVGNNGAHLSVTGTLCCLARVRGSP
jgi:putative transposase